MDRLYTLVLFILLSSSIPGSASTEREDEIQHLLEFIVNSGCTFIRNNNEYPSMEAKSHIEMKYKYAKSRISSTEDFIKYAATKSSMSGEHYMVRCNGENKTSSQWLLEELADYRRHHIQPEITPDAK